MDIDDDFAFFAKVETPSSFLQELHQEASDFKQFEPSQYQVAHYSEQLYLEHTLIVATHTVWKFLVTELSGAVANAIQVEVSGKFEPFNEPFQVSVEIIHCTSAEEFETLSKARRVINDVPTWKAYHLPPVYLHDVRFPGGVIFFYFFFGFWWKLTLFFW